MQDPITRARARQLNLQVRSFLVNYFSNLTVGGAHVLLIRNLGEDQKGLGKGRGVEEEQLGRPHRAGAQAQLDFDSTSESRSRPHKIDAQDAYRLRFGRSIYGWKENFIEFPMAPVPYQTSI